MQRTQPKSNLRPFAMVALFALLAAAIVAAIYAATGWSAIAKARKLKNPVPATSDALDAGMKTYQEHCQSCHGAKGDGKGDRASELSVAPGDFTDAQKINRLADGELYWQITKGRMPMPSFGAKLSDEQRWQLVDYIRTFAQPPPRQ